MSKAEEALEARERERKAQAELAKKQQTEKQIAFRRSVRARQEVWRSLFCLLIFQELKRDAEKIANQAKPGDKRKSLIVYMNDRSSKRKSSQVIKYVTCYS